MKDFGSRNIRLLRSQSIYENKTSYILISLYLLLYTINILTLSKLPIFPLINRVTYGYIVNWSLTGSSTIDQIIDLSFFIFAVYLIFKRRIAFYFLIPIVVITTFSIFTLDSFYLNVTLILSLPFLLTLFMISKDDYVDTRSGRKNWLTSEFTNIFFLVLLFLEIIVLLRWIAYPMTHDFARDNLSWKINSLHDFFFYSFGLISPHILIVALLFFLVRPLIPSLISWLENRYFKVNGKEFSSVLFPKWNYNFIFKSLEKRFSNFLENKYNFVIFLVLTSVIPSAIVPIYGYLVAPKHDTNLGTDIPGYLDSLSILSSSHNISSFFHNLFFVADDGGRTLSILSMYAMVHLSGQSPELVLRYLPCILGPALVLAVCYFVYSIHKDRKLITAVAIMTAFSHQIMIGFYAAYYSNWMALISMFIAILFLLKATNQNYFQLRPVALYAVFGTLTLFFHSYSWTYFMAAVFFFLGWSAFISRTDRKKLYVIIVLVIVTLGIITIDLIKSYYVGTSGGFQKDINLSGVSFQQFFARWINLDLTFKVYLGGFLTNSYTLLLVLFWAVYAKYSDSFDRFLLSLMVIAILPVLFGNLVVESRIFYLLPFEIPAGIMIYKIFTNTRIPFRKYLILALILIQVNYVLRGMSNMFFIAPS